MPLTEKLVTLNRLGVLLDAYGAAPERWPEEERSAALALIDTSADAQALLEEARAVDGLLGQIETPTVSPALLRKVHGLRQTRRPSLAAPLVARVRDWLPPGPRFAWQGAVAAAAVIGIATGIGFSEIVLDAPSTAPIVQVADAVQPDMLGDGVPAFLVSDTAYDPGPMIATSLGTNLTEISLTGNNGINGGPIVQADDSEIAVASIPLY